MRGFVLLVVAIVLAIIILPVGFGYQIISSLFKALNEYLFKVAKSIDQLGNVVCRDLFNDTLIKKDGYRFGNEDRTISHVLGMNEKTKTLSILGMGLAWILNTIDKDHNRKAIENECKS
jgi:8-oxo-dGTP diphosphatase